MSTGSLRIANAASGLTLILIFPAAISASASFNIYTNAMVNAAPP